MSPRLCLKGASYGNDLMDEEMAHARNHAVDVDERYEQDAPVCDGSAYLPIPTSWGEPPDYVSCPGCDNCEGGDDDD